MTTAQAAPRVLVAKSADGMRISNLGLAMVLLASTATAAQSGARETFERAAAGWERGLNYGDVLYGRIDPALWPSRGDARMAELLARHDAVEDLVALLEHPNPRVRSLAIAALYDREDPKLLPRIAALAHDDARSIPEPQPTSRRAASSLDAPVQLTERTVGWWAKLIVDHYMELAGYAYGVDGAAGQPGFAEYWRTRADREFCASWLEVRVQRAYGGAFPIRGPMLERLRAVRLQIDGLPPLDRSLTLLWITSGAGFYEHERPERALATEAECVDAARALGRDNLLAILRRKTPGDDPDLRAHAGKNTAGCTCAGMAEFVLRHAAQLLAPEDARELLDLGAREHEHSVDPDAGSMDTVWWWIAAADLQRKDAHAALDGAYERFRRDNSFDAEARADLMVAHSRLCTCGGDAWPIERFYAESSEHDLTPPARARFVEALARDDSPAARATLVRLIRDARFSQIDLGTLRVFVQVINAWVDPDLVDEHALYGLAHPLGDGGVATPQRIARAMETHPGATKSVLAELDRWRALVVASIERWPPASAK